MGILSKRQIEAIDLLFYNASKLEEEIKAVAAERRAAAFNSADPTAKEAVEHLASVPYALGYDNPELWLQAVNETWEKYEGTSIGKIMHRRYCLKETWQRTVYESYVSDAVYFRYRSEFILYAALMLAKKGIDLELSDGKMLSEGCKK